MDHLLINNSKEFFNDPYDSTPFYDYDACFAGYKIPDATRANDSLRTNFFGDKSGSIANHRGVFYGCNLSSDNIIFSIEDDLSGDSLLPSDNNLFVCSNVSDFVCSTTGNFLYKSTPIFNNLQGSYNYSLAYNVSGEYLFDPLNPKHRLAECCPSESCWNGSVCVSEYSKQRRNYSGVNYTFVCRDSQWSRGYTDSELRYNWDRTGSDFCFSPDQCFCGSLCPAEMVFFIDPVGDYKKGCLESKFHKQREGDLKVAVMSIIKSNNDFVGRYWLIVSPVIEKFMKRNALIPIIPKEPHLIFEIFRLYNCIFRGITFFFTGEFR